MTTTKTCYLMEPEMLPWQGWRHSRGGIQTRSRRRRQKTARGRKWRRRRRRRYILLHVRRIYQMVLTGYAAAG
eukprot:754738-Hanusia_phi.AAC.1